LAFLTQNKAKLCKILIITLVFEKNANFFRRKLSKIAENCDHNIDPRHREKVAPKFAPLPFFSNVEQKAQKSLYIFLLFTLPILSRDSIINTSVVKKFIIKMSES
jgi:hypothetical protein